MLGNNLVGGWVSCSLFPKYAIPIHEKLFAVRGKKKWPKCHFLAQFFLGWVGLGFLGSLVGFIIILICFSDPIELVNRKPPSIHCTAVVLIALTFWMHD